MWVRRIENEGVTLTGMGMAHAAWDETASPKDLFVSQPEVALRWVSWGSPIHPGDRGWGFGIPLNPQWKIPKISSIPGIGIWDFWGWKSPRYPQSRGWGFGIFEAEKSPINSKSGGFITGIENFRKSGDLYPWNFYPRGLRIFVNLGIFIPGIFAKSPRFISRGLGIFRGFFFWGWGFFCGMTIFEIFK